METGKGKSGLEKFLENDGFPCLMTCIVGIITFIFLGFILYSIGMSMSVFYYVFGVAFIPVFGWSLYRIVKKPPHLKEHPPRVE